MEIEWAAKKEIEIAKIKLDEKTTHLEHKYNMEKLTNDKIKNTLHVQTQSEILVKIAEQGCSPSDYCMMAGLSYFTLKDELAKEEIDAFKEAMFGTSKRKNKVNSKPHGRHASISGTGCEIDQDTADNHNMVSTMALL